MYAMREVATCNDLAASLRSVGVRVEVDDRENYNPGTRGHRGEVFENENGVGEEPSRVPG